MTILILVALLAASSLIGAFLVRDRAIVRESLVDLRVAGVVERVHASEASRKLNREIAELTNVNTAFQEELAHYLRCTTDLEHLCDANDLEIEQTDQALMYAEEERQYWKTLAREHAASARFKLNDLKIAKMDDDRMFQMLTGRLEAAVQSLRILQENGASVTMEPQEDGTTKVDVTIKAPEGHQFVPISTPADRDDELSAQGMPDFMRSDYDGPEPDDLMGPMGPQGAPAMDERIIELLEQIAFNTTESHLRTDDTYPPELAPWPMQDDEAPELYPDPKADDRLAQLRADGLLPN